MNWRLKKSKIKWIGLVVVVVSAVSLFFHLFNISSAELSHYTAVAGLREGLATRIGKQRYLKLWGSVEPLEVIQPYAKPRGSWPAPNGKSSNGIIYAKVFGGFEKIRSSISDLVAISRLLNATLVIPEIQQSLASKGISSKFKSFSYLYDEDMFISSLANDIIIMKSLPESLMADRKMKKFLTFRPKSSASPNYYLREILPFLKASKVIGLILTDGGCLQPILPPSMYEYQRLRCRVAFHALHFRQEIQKLGHKMVERLRQGHQPFLAYHSGLMRETLAYHGCAELFRDVHTELIQYRRAQMIKEKIIKEDLTIDSFARKRNGSCPFMPEEVGILLKAMGYPPQTIIYLAGSELFGGQHLAVPLRAMFENTFDFSSLCTKKELSNLIGPENPLPPNTFIFPPPKSAEQLLDEWKKAGPRPRPLPPPPDRPIYKHEKEGWYGWITESKEEPDPTPLDLRNQAHRLLWDALDFIVSVEADAFFPGFHSDGSMWPDFSSLVMGQRLYASASSKTYRPDRQVLMELLNIADEDHNIYNQDLNWTHSVQKHLNKTLAEDGLIRQSIFSKPISFLSHPLPECSCRFSSSDYTPKTVTNPDGRFLYGGEDECPEGTPRLVSLEDSGPYEGLVDETDSMEIETDNGSNMNMSLLLSQDEDMDPND